MDYRILGQLEVSDGDRPLALGGEKQRALLAVLLLHAGEVLSADRLIDELWGERSPSGAPKALQAHISRLRKALDANGAGPADAAESTGSSRGGVLLTQGHGYVLRVRSGELDLDRFQAAVDEGRRALVAGDPQRAADTLRAGLELWRGPPLADLAYEPFAQAPIAELEELHLGAVEDRVEADLALGRHEQLVGELAALVKQYPLRERLRAQLMLALHRCGRQAEALDVYQEHRRGLAGELGLDPSPRLQRLEAAILERDPSLDPPVGGRRSADGTVGEQLPRRVRRRRGRPWLALGAGVAVAAVVAVAVLPSRGGHGPSAIAPDSVGAISPSDGAITATVAVGSSPSSVAAGDGAVWVANYNDDSVSRIDQATHTVEQKIQGVSTPSGIAVGPSGVWVANTFTGTVSRINPAVNMVVATIPVGNGPSGVAVGDGLVWVTNTSDGTLSRIDPATDKAKTIPLAGGATDVAVGYKAVWVSDDANGQVLRIDPHTNHETQPINVGAGPTAITVGFDSVWVANSLDGTVSRINPLTNEVAAKISVGSTPNAIAVGAGGVWVANEFGGNLVRIDPKTNSIARSIAVGNSPRGVAFAGGLLWASAQATATTHRGGTLIALQSSPFGPLDPATVVNTASVMTLFITNDGLTTFKRVGGSDGAQVVPDLAVSIPTPTDGGLTYVFQLRRGIRYSNGEPVRPEDFRRAIERDLTLKPSELDASAFFGIVGAAQCVANPRHCDLSRGIAYDDAADTVTFHLTSADPEFPDALALWGAVAVPAASPLRDVGRHPLPATGPYEVASDTPHQVALVRNPYFHEWSHAAQPDGYPDRIVWKIGASVEAATAAVERDAADYTLALPANRLNELHTRFTNRLHVYPNDETIALALNTRRAPFNDVRVRRAINYAVDRSKLAQLFGQYSRATCQYLPPYISGYQRYCPYTLNPDHAGDWSAPNLPKAQALIAASKTRGTRITIWNQNFPELGIDFTPAGTYVKSLLDRLGYPTQIKTFSVKNPTRVGLREADSRTAPQAFFGVGLPLYPAPSQFLATSWTCQEFIPGSTNNGNTEEFCDPRFDAMVRRALAADAAKSPSAQLWANADHELANEAPVVNLVNPSITDFVSSRAGNYQYNPWIGILIDQLWVR